MAFLRNRKARDSALLPAAKPFVCKRCGNCCTGEGYVNVTPEDCERLAESLKLPLEEFLERYTRQMAGFDRWLRDGEGADLPCVFLSRDAGGRVSCRVHDAKPTQCREFPATWRRPDAAQWCAGLRDGAGNGRGKANAS
jgi:hypothetical protein